MSGAFAEAGPVGHHPLAVAGLDVASHQRQVLASQCLHVGLRPVRLGRFARVAAELDQDQQVDHPVPVRHLHRSGQFGRLGRVQGDYVHIEGEVAGGQRLDHSQLLAGGSLSEVGCPQEAANDHVRVVVHARDGTRDGPGRGQPQ